MSRQVRVWAIRSIPVVLFLLGLIFVVIRPIGFKLVLIPGDLGDVRFNNYILEHFYRWLIGLDASFWDAPIFYPYPLTTAFSDNLLGSALLYAGLRWSGLDRETAYQGWYILGFCLNFAAAVFVLSRLKLSSLAAGAGAFYFTFGLPILAQENHPQLLYRFGIPLACFFLWRMVQKPNLYWLVALLGAVTMQFFLGIYEGFFLGLLLFFMVILMPVCLPGLSLRDRVWFWPGWFRAAWSATRRARIITILALPGLCAGLVWLFWPYFQVTKIYGFTRTWQEIASMLPRWQSYAIADGAKLWQQVSETFLGVPVRNEHQLFPGILAVVCLLLTLVAVWCWKNENSGWVLVHLGALICLVALTLSVDDFSLYQWIWQLPGINSIRSITRIILVLMWPLAVCITFGIDLLVRAKVRFAPALVALAVILVLFQVAESTQYNHLTFSKAGAQARIRSLRQQISADVPADPVVFVSTRPDEPTWAVEVDAMLLGQDLGWPVFNGYSGNIPANYENSETCVRLPQRILTYQKFSSQTSSERYMNLMQRSVPLGFQDCDPAWWSEMPSFTSFSGPLPDKTIRLLEIKVVSLSTTLKGLRARLELNNPSSISIPARSSTGNRVYLSCRWVNLGAGQTPPEFTPCKAVELDLLPDHPAISLVPLDVPTDPGVYILEVSAYQKGLAKFQDRGMAIARSVQTVRMDAVGQVSLVDP
jgi:hypothetical protein